MRNEPELHEDLAESFFGALDISSPGRIGLFFACFAVALGLALLASATSDIGPAANRALFVLLFAGLLWTTEAIPAFAVGLGVIGLQIALFGRPGGVFATSDRDWEAFVAVIGHPLVWLFFGGFVLAAGMQRTRLDRRIAAGLLARTGDRPTSILFGVMGITFALSMFVSNTATAAMMLALLGPLLARIPSDDRFGVGLLLGLALAANLGGMATLIGTPPNAIAVGVLADVAPGQDISFLGWMLLGLPPALALLLVGGALLARLYPSSAERLDLGALVSDDDAPPVPAWQKLVVSGTLIATVGGWLTSQWHGIPTAAISMVPIVALTTTGVLGTAQIRGLNYDVLFLLAGGLALGQMATETGLSTWIVDRLPLAGLPLVGLAVLMAFLTVVLSNFMSNTAAANILVPIGVTMAIGAEAQVAVPIALAASCAMLLPISTPPNALAYATGRLETRELLRVGVVLGLVGPLVAILWTQLALEWVLSRI